RRNKNGFWSIFWICRNVVRTLFDKSTASALQDPVFHCICIGRKWIHGSEFPEGICSISFDNNFHNTAFCTSHDLFQGSTYRRYEAHFACVFREEKLIACLYFFPFF